MTIAHPDYAQLAAQLRSQIYTRTLKKSFSETMNDMFNYVNPETVNTLRYYLSA
jgi:ribonucleoside-diphosphate reductase alpha chain